LVIAAVITAVWLLAGVNQLQAEEKRYDDLYVCSMHPWEASEGPGSCSLCGMNLSQVYGHQPGDPLPHEEDLYVSPDDPLYVHLGEGSDPQSGADLIPITQSPYYQPRKPVQDHSQHRHESDGEITATESGLWTCGMHPDVIQDEPGICPICQMELTPLKNSTNSSGGAAIQIDPVTLQNIGVVTEMVKRRDLSRFIRTNGTIAVAEDAQVRVNARISGWVEKLYVSRTGDPVKKGQKLLEIYSPELVTAQEEYLLALQNAEMLSKSGLSQVSANGHDLLASARRRLELWDVSADQITRLDKTRKFQRTLALTSPADGIVLHKNVIAGSAIKSGMDLFLIAALKEVWMRGQVYEYELPWIAEGNQVTITSSYDPTFESAGYIDYVYPVLDAKTRTAEIRVVLPNPDLKLKPEMYVDAVITAETKTDVISAPKSSVVRSGVRDLVFVAWGGGQFEPREVHRGIETDGYYEILQGLIPGEEVVTSAQFLLDSEAKLQEAIERRLESRQRLQGDADVPETEIAEKQTGHVH
jgi:Cu(I)/Ag(I) efflux system membrane fusion protein/cobalt-zinc-cadmium efflux system membrane fusion protein